MGMTDTQLIAIVKFLVQLKAENLALLKWLRKDSDKQFGSGDCGAAPMP